jgi:uncharacterized OB-fold protein
MTDARIIFRAFFGAPRRRDIMAGLCRWCGKALGENANPRRKYCCRSHRQRDYEYRHGLKTGETFTTPKRKNR